MQQSNIKALSTTTTSSSFGGINERSIALFTALPTQTRIKNIKKKLQKQTGGHRYLSQLLLLLIFLQRNITTNE